MRPKNLKTKIFLDSGDPNETREVIATLGFLDGQTTNPTLVAKHPYAKERFEKGEKFTAEEILHFYQKIVSEISDLIPNGSVSVEVVADRASSARELFLQGMEMSHWIPNAHVKYPITYAGLSAAKRLVSLGGRVNMTLCFTQEQAAAVYSATKGAAKGNVFISPFVGRLDDIGENGLDLVANIVKLYRRGDHHAEVLSASVRTIDHFIASIVLGADIVTAPLKVLKQWKELGTPTLGIRRNASLRPILREDVSLSKSWCSYNIEHPMTEKGLDLFSADWNRLIR